MRNIMINILASFCLLLIFSPVVVQAYYLLEPLPGAPRDISLGEYLPAVFRTVLALAGFLAVTKIVIGAIYITAAGGSEANQSKGREMIRMALWGLLLALSTVLIMRSINPQLIKANL